jgi:cytoskeletal protein RodZ
MKEIGEKFKEAREAIGISKDEVIKDLNITESQLDNLEDGNINAFKDVFFLEDTIKKYTKYLNLDEDEIMDSFNNFMFGFTSRIPVEDILEKTREFEILEKQNEDNKIVSPYTVKRKGKSTLKYVLIFGVATIILVVLVILIIKYITDKPAMVGHDYYNVVKGV